MALSVQPDETALELLRRANRKPLRTGLTFFDEVQYFLLFSRGDMRGVGRGDIVELYGPSGCGKSEVLINVVVQSVLPAWLGGEESTAVYFDNDGRLSILRLEQLLKEKIISNKTFQVKNAAGGIGGARREIGGSDSLALENRVEAVLVECLRRLRVVRPTSLFELLASIEVLRFELGHRAAVIAVDGVGSFYWQDKMAQGCGGEALMMQGAVVKALVRLVMERPIAMFAAKTAIFGSRGSASDAEHREYLPQAWQRAVTHRILLRRRQRRPRSLRRQRGDEGEPDVASAFSLFTARVSRSKGARSGAGSGAASSTSSGGGKGRAVATVEDRELFFFVVSDDGIHDVPAAAIMGEVEEWGDERR
ncbi:unnamed protein product [Ascophyllum nodosum]